MAELRWIISVHFSMGNKASNQTKTITIINPFTAPKINPKELWILKCKHAFHRPCLKEWLNFTMEEEQYMNNDLECPLCRNIIFLNNPNKKNKKILTSKEKYFYDSKVLNMLEEY